jgi:hypothetical protein
VAMCLTNVVHSLGRCSCASARLLVPVLSQMRLPRYCLSMCQIPPRFVRPDVAEFPMAFSFQIEPRDARCGAYSDPPRSPDQRGRMRRLECRWESS